MTSACHDAEVTKSKVSNDVCVKICVHSDKHALGKNRIFEDTKLQANMQFKSYIKTKPIITV